MNNVVKIAYATPDKKFIENFQFSSLTVLLGPEKEWLDSTAALMAKDVFAMATRSYKDSVCDGVRRIEVDGEAAIVRLRGGPPCPAPDDFRVSHHLKWSLFLCPRF